MEARSDNGKFYANQSRELSDLIPSNALSPTVSDPSGEISKHPYTREVEPKWKPEIKSLAKDTCFLKDRSY